MSTKLISENYVIEEGVKELKTPKAPQPQDYYDITESLEERQERILNYEEEEVK